MPTWIRHVATRWRWTYLATGCLALAGLIYAGYRNRHSWHWGDFPTWVAAIATLGLLIGAAITVYYARKAFNAQSQQLADQLELSGKQAVVLGPQEAELKQSIAERRRDRDQRHRAQASLVFITMDVYKADHDRAAANAQMKALLAAKDERAVLLAAHVTNSSEKRTCSREPVRGGS